MCSNGVSFVPQKPIIEQILIKAKSPQEKAATQLEGSSRDERAFQQTSDAEFNITSEQETRELFKTPNITENPPILTHKSGKHKRTCCFFRHGGYFCNVEEECIRLLSGIQKDAETANELSRGFRKAYCILAEAGIKQKRMAEKKGKEVC